MVKVAPHILEAIVKAAKAAPDTEICGLLIGAGDRIAEIAPSPNRHPDPARGFAICDELYARTQAQAREAGLAVVGCYHSHPSGDMTPSDMDVLAVQEDGFVWIIAAPHGAAAAWRAVMRPPVKGFEPLAIG
jgi:proteasome lid subunit RPN8/RPN11